MSDENTNRFLDAARRIRPELPGLLKSAAAAAAYDRDIEALLQRSVDDPEGARARLQVLLGSRPETARWMRRATASWGAGPLRPQGFEERGIDGLGPAMPVPRRKFVCPVDGKYSRFQRDASIDMGLCPDHQVALVAE
ncbi:MULTISPECIES: hypothetical protein [Amycolatopsis]|uniref:DUF222 domain-containing protein n=1 Tax=Amycolatopsis albidoflavus TaxID=102226 RepID=A0ABW5I873_9PSEU